MDDTIITRRDFLGAGLAIAGSALTGCDGPQHFGGTIRFKRVDIRRPA